MSYTPKILIVDDEPLMCDSMKELISDRGYKIHTAHSGKEAMEGEQEKQIEEPKPELIKGTGIILLIEGQEIVMKVLRAMLEILGYHVLRAKTGEKAIDIAGAFDGAIDLAILSIVLPDMRGWTIYPLLMEARPNLKVLVCSGYFIDGPVQEILDMGAQDFIQKPFSVAALSEKLKVMLEN